MRADPTGEEPRLPTRGLERSPARCRANRNVINSASLGFKPGRKNLVLHWLAMGIIMHIRSDVLRDLFRPNGPSALRERAAVNFLAKFSTFVNLKSSNFSQPQDRANSLANRLSAGNHFANKARELVVIVAPRGDARPAGAGSTQPLARIGLSKEFHHYSPTSPDFRRARSIPSRRLTTTRL